MLCQHFIHGDSRQVKHVKSQLYGDEIGKQSKITELHFNPIIMAPNDGNPLTVATA